MVNKSRYKGIAITAYILIGLGLIVLGFVFKQNILIASIVYIVSIIIFIFTLLSMDKNKKEDYREIERNMASLTKISIEEGNTGFVMYDNNFKITYMNKHLKEKLQDHVGEKLLNWLPDLQDVVTDATNQQLIIINDDKFLVTKDKKK